MVLGIWCGEGKAPLNEYLHPLVSELKEIIESGIQINDFNIKIKFGRCVCDTPARSYIKGVVSFMHTRGCQKCLVEGKYSNIAHRMSFPCTDAQKRTDESFRKRLDPSHHKQLDQTPFEALNIDMITSFPIADDLHLLHLGVTKKCMMRWIRGEKNYPHKWKRSTTENVSKLLLNLNKYLPTDLHRSIRSLDVIKYWKGLEFRTILLYVGVVVFKTALNQDEYEHFLTLFCAVTLCYSKMYKKYTPVAAKMFDDYVKNYIRIYGQHSITSNVHNLAHIVDDMKSLNVENLTDISSYRYENSLRLLGLKVKHSNLPLEQIVRRISEASSTNNEYSQNISSDFKFEPICKDCYKMNENEVFRRVLLKPGVELSTKNNGDKWFMTKDTKIIQLKYIYHFNNSYKICGVELKQKNPFFVTPINSIKLNIYLSDGEMESKDQIFDLSTVFAKIICLPYHSNFVFIPLLHSLDVLNP